MLIPVYQTIDGNEWLGCKSFQKEPVRHVDVTYIQYVSVMDRPNDAWVYCLVCVLVANDGYRTYSAKMSSKTFYSLAVSGVVGCGGDIDCASDLEMTCKNPEWEISERGI